MDKEVLLLKEENVFGFNKLEIFKIINPKSSLTDLGIILGGNIDIIMDNENYFGKVTKWYLENNMIINQDGYKKIIDNSNENYALRPIIKFNEEEFNKIIKNNNEIIIEYGKYPQYVENHNICKEIEKEYEKGKLRKTGNIYTLFDTNKGYKTYYEYRYKGNKYIRIEYNNDNIEQLTNRKEYHKGEICYVKVSPINWYVDYKERLLISKTSILANIDYNNRYEFLNKYFINEIIHIKENNNYNTYNFDLDLIKEEEMINSLIECNIPIFLHGESGIGKSARIKEIDKDCIIIYLRNSSLESINGKSVYNSDTNSMIDIKPSWLVKLEEICKREPNKNHILFFDEITNSFPSIQGIIFNIILDREVNGIWKLPENARIVAAGNEESDSVSANKLAEPLYNRFAHIYIETNPDLWLKWAIEHNIHPLVYNFIKNNNNLLKTKYDGEKPNADPRKWEMASKMLYKTKNPYMLKSLIGEELMEEFIDFYKNISLEKTKIKEK